MLHATVVSLVILAGTMLAGSTGAMVRAVTVSGPAGGVDAVARRWAYVGGASAVLTMWAALALSFGA